MEKSEYVKNIPFGFSFTIIYETQDCRGGHLCAQVTSGLELGTQVTNHEATCPICKIWIYIRVW